MKKHISIISYNMTFIFYKNFFLQHRGISPRSFAVYFAFLCV